MQHHARIVQSLARGIDRVAQDRMAKREHMHPQLMAAPSQRHQAHPRGFAIMALHPPVGDGRLALFMVHMLARAIGPINAKRQVHRALFRLQQAPKPREINLFRLPFLELLPQMALRRLGQRKDHHARRVAIQPMHQQHLGEDPAQTLDQAIFLAGVFSGYREEPCGLVHDQQRGIVMQDVQRHIGWIVFIGRHQAISCPSARSRAARWAIWAGPTSQQPPTIVAPCATQSMAKSAYFSGVRSWRWVR